MRIYTIPNFITLGNLACGMYGIQCALLGDLKMAAGMIALAMLLDFLDGFAARILKMASPIGKELDSLADVVSFGVLPSFILFALIQNESGKYLAFLPALFSALRLAKFNLDERQSDTFYGVPTPTNALLVAAFPFLMGGSFFAPILGDPFYWAYSMLISFLLVWDYPLLALKFKDFSWKNNRFRYTLLLSSLVLLLSVQVSAIPFIFILYLVLSFFSNASEKKQV
ncbi:CDP-diacylglycerol--serine O-phosphatidyltransferase [Marinilongibacter aquaticus]|uniref:CDP-diacylglycerol--serine O-phosphatidyltransferase n=1 Tax=Marinilongibacter aquaticus TaxID=2975157 RepID=UPI0021BD4F5C|nr:CDP-diacylglycerol--serine O-phosphatidyltransferase [Marinilongibacter aquaticus]UBM60675.1 CDP-diacylglycerol--serine O-phosphatidyltransferase [Marinilongibacter aquaticus]